MYSIEHLTL